MVGIAPEERTLNPSYNPSFWEIFGQSRHIRIIVNVVPLLTLGIMGGAILPVPAAFATTGIAASVISMVVIAACMIYTCELLLYQTLCVGQRDYESLSEAIGGKTYRIFTEVWLCILMIGTLLGSIVQFGETCASGILLINPNAPGALVNGSGRVLMVIAVLCMAAFVFAKTYRSLEVFGDFGFFVVLVMVIVIMVRCIELDFPALKDGQFKKIGFNDLNTFGSAISTYGFMFYLQPVMMPVLNEMPPGVYGVRLLLWCTRLAIGGTGFIMYFLAGFFGAALFGDDTEGNILENNLGGSGKPQAALNIFMAAYVALGLIPFEYACRHALDSLVIQACPKLNHQKYDLWRRIGEGFFIYGLSLGLSLAVPGKSSQIIAVTGATGVLVVCYGIPIINHYLLWAGRAKAQKDPSVIHNIARASGTEILVPAASPIELESFGVAPNEAGYKIENDRVAPKQFGQDPETADLNYWRRPSTLQFGLGSPYLYTTMTPFWKAFHLVAPILCIAVGGFASALTLKSLADD